MRRCAVSAANRNASRKLRPVTPQTPSPLPGRCFPLSHQPSPMARCDELSHSGQAGANDVRRFPPCHGPKVLWSETATEIRLTEPGLRAARAMYPELARRWSLERFPNRRNRKGIPESAKIGFMVEAGLEAGRDGQTLFRRSSRARGSRGRGGKFASRSGWAIRRQREFRRQADAAFSCDGKFPAF
jgi:hypothetical protein